MSATTTVDHLLAQAGMKPAGLDAVVPFQVDALDARGRAVLLGDSLDAILSRHDYPEPVARLLGEMVALTSLLGTSLKFEGKFIVQAQTQGPVSLLVVDYVTPGSLRAYARFDADAVAETVAAGRGEPQDLLGTGVLALTVDQGAHTNRYQGIVQLDGASLEEIARNYFRQSEQIPTEIRLAVGRLMTRGQNGQVGHHWRAGGIIVQFLPESTDRIRNIDLHPGEAPAGTIIETPYEEENDDDAWTEVKALVGTIDDGELIDADVGVHTLLFLLFNERGVRVFEPQVVHEQCSCSPQKVEAVLRSLGEEDLKDAATDGMVQMTCEFCSTNYHYALADLVEPGNVET